MHTLRIVLAGFSVLLAGVIVAGQISLMRGHAPVHILDHAVVFTLALCLLATGFYYFHSLAYWMARLSCPKCHRSGVLRLATFGQPRVSALGWIIGGFIDSLLYSYARKHRFHCDACDASSRVRTLGGWLAAAWLFYLALALAVTIYVHGNT